MIQDLALTPTDQAIISRVRQGVQPQNNTVNSGSVISGAPVVQNGVVTLLGNVQNVGEKQRLGSMIEILE